VGVRRRPIGRHPEVYPPRIEDSGRIIPVVPAEPIEIAAVAPREWPLVERLLGSGRSSGSCWCMWFRLTPKDFDGETLDSRRAAQRARVAAGRTLALLATQAGEPVGWLSFGPVEEFRPRLERWSIAPRSFEPGAWAIVCLFIREPDRRARLGGQLIRAAVDAARAAGATGLVAFPLISATRPLPEGATGVGYAEQYLEAGFELRPGAIESRPIAVHRFADSPIPGP
jgi:GNAT superfamily N-acetyltransferase